MSEITVGMCVELDPGHEYGLFDYGGSAPYGGTVEEVYPCGDVRVRFYDETEDGWAWIEWSMPATIVHRLVPEKTQKAD